MAFECSLEFVISLFVLELAKYCFMAATIGELERLIFYFNGLLFPKNALEYLRWSSCYFEISLDQESF